MDESAAPVPPPAKTRPRFPWLPALLCAASLGAAVWTWMTYSYAWEVTPRTLIHAYDSDYGSSWEGGYVTIRGQIASLTLGSSRPPVPSSAYVLVAQEGNRGAVDEQLREFKDTLTDAELSECEAALGSEDVELTLDAMAQLPDLRFQTPVRITWDDWMHRSLHRVWNGRVVNNPRGLAVDTTASRFHLASITGLVVGGMGVFVFAVYLRTWVKGRRVGG